MELPTLDLSVERPVAGGLMLARHEGRVVLVGGAIPGERVRARVDRERRDVIFATWSTFLTQILIAGRWKAIRRAEDRHIATLRTNGSDS